ncbi:hypothetical protein GDO81_026213 [Engystomops pustulosus]|uniref:Uncharacterized protein n=1 Tax=Engystomops pustulosus TaxID=76066 RepID=A0AAV6YG94_ENGPU|nr:hypothetical protein GDO81_026213 [Engystomops pustulosus]
MSRYVLPEVLLLTLSACFTFAGLHTHYFYVTVTSEWTDELPLYTTTRTLDDITLLRYDSDQEVLERRVPWFQSPFSSLLDASLSYLSIQNSDENLLRVISEVMGHTGGK